jgi:hypothetical protein
MTTYRKERVMNEEFLVELGRVSEDTKGVDPGFEESIQRPDKEPV